MYERNIVCVISVAISWICKWPIYAIGQLAGRHGVQTITIVERCNHLDCCSHDLWCDQWFLYFEPIENTIQLEHNYRLNVRSFSIRMTNVRARILRKKKDFQRRMNGQTCLIAQLISANNIHSPPNNINTQKKLELVPIYQWVTMIEMNDLIIMLYSEVKCACVLCTKLIM